ncbi:MAG TPA: TraE/TraK family type IV conjugative transfer system protein [Caulobacteraceae bacterium]|nr:TraE/TraK family type IV conjugative transfer system protein [Caulobacteraceae bacterium]
MRVDHAIASARRLNLRLTLTAGLLALSVSANLVQSIVLMSARQVVLVPTLPETTSISASGALDRDYFERVVRDVAYLFLNRTPESARYFERAIERIADAKTYQAIKAALIDDRRQRIASRTSQTFYPDDFYLDPADLYAEVAGTLEVSNGSDILDRRPAVYAVRFVRRGSAIRLSSFVELKPEEALGRKAKPIKTEDLQ